MRAKTGPEIAKETRDALERDARFQRDIAELQSLLTGAKVEKARSLVKELEGRWPESDLVRRFARVLAPPVARIVEGRTRHHP